MYKGYHKALRSKETRSSGSHFKSFGKHQLAEKFKRQSDKMNGSPGFLDQTRRSVPQIVFNKPITQEERQELIKKAVDKMLIPPDSNRQSISSKVTLEKSSIDVSALQSDRGKSEVSVKKKKKMSPF